MPCESHASPMNMYVVCELPAIVRTKVDCELYVFVDSGAMSAGPVPAHERHEISRVQREGEGARAYRDQRDS